MGGGADKNADQAGPRRGRIAFWGLGAAAVALSLVLLLRPNEYSTYASCAPAWDRQDIQVVYCESADRIRLAPILRALAAIEPPPRAIGVDIKFNDPSEDPAADDAFADALAFARRRGVGVVLGARTTNRPLPRFLEHGVSSGLVDVETRQGETSGIAAVAPPLFGLAVHLAPYALGDDPDREFRLDGDRLTIRSGANRRVFDLYRRKTDGVLTLEIDYARGYLPFLDWRQLAGSPALDNLRDSVVLLGIHPSSDVHHVSAIDPDRTIPGLVVHAHALRTLVSGTQPTRLQLPKVALLVVLAAFVSIALSWRIRWPVVGFALAVLLIVLLFAAGARAYRAQRVRLPVKAMSIACFCAFSLDAWRRLRDQRRAFREYVAEVDAARDAGELHAPEAGRLPDLDSLPHPIAQLRKSGAGYTNLVELATHFIDVAEITIKVMAAILAGDLKRRSERDWRASLALLRRPSLGHFWQFSRQAADSCAPADAAAPELVELLRTTAMRKRIDRLVQVRNSIRHGSARSAAKSDLIEALRGDVDGLLDSLGFLGRYPLCIVKSVSSDQDGKRAEVDVWMGPRDGGPDSLRIADDRIGAGVLAAIARKSGAVMPVAPILERLARDGRPSFCVANGVTPAGKVRYLSYSEGWTLRSEQDWPA